MVEPLSDKLDALMKELPEQPTQLPVTTDEQQPAQGVDGSFAVRLIEALPDLSKNPANLIKQLCTIDETTLGWLP